VADYDSIVIAITAWTGKIQGYESQAMDSDYIQPGELWNEFKSKPPMDKNFISNVAINLSMANQDVREKTYGRFRKLVEGRKANFETSCFQEN